MNLNSSTSLPATHPMDTQLLSHARTHPGTLEAPTLPPSRRSLLSDPFLLVLIIASSTAVHGRVRRPLFYVSSSIVGTETTHTSQAHVNRKMVTKLTTTASRLLQLQHKVKLSSIRDVQTYIIVHASRSTIMYTSPLPCEAVKPSPGLIPRLTGARIRLSAARPKRETGTCT